jgi:hypothetical protein
MTDSEEESDSTGGEEAKDSLEQLVESIEERRQTDDDRPASETPDPTDAVDELVGDESPPARDEGPVEAPDVEELEDAGNVLVLGPLRGRACDSTCASLLTGSEPENVLFVTLTHSAENRLEVTRQFADHAPERVAVVRVGSSQTRERSALSTATGPAELTVTGVDDPSDLTRLGITISRCRSQWEADAPTTVCVHSLTELLQYADKQRLFRFIHILQAKLDAPNTVAHFHMDPEAHDPQTRSVFRTLFDTVVEINDDGTLTVTDTDD